MNQQLRALSFLATILFFITLPYPPLSGVFASFGVASKPVLGVAMFSLEKRYNDSFVNGVFKDNILLTIGYMRGIVKDSRNVNWDEMREPFVYSFELKPQETFAFHEDVLPEFKESLTVTTGAHFNYQDGFKHSGLMYGDGVCHLASLLNKAALDAGLYTKVPANHDFRAIPEMEREFGVAIFFFPGNPAANAYQNLYITNTKEKPVVFEMSYNGEILTVEVTEK